MLFTAMKRERPKRINTSPSPEEAPGFNLAVELGHLLDDLPLSPMESDKPTPDEPLTNSESPSRAFPLSGKGAEPLCLRREKSGRGGKTVVVISRLPSSWSAEDRKALARHLQQSCGCGGTVRGEEIEIQGDQPARIARLLQDAGFRVIGTVS